MIISSGENVYPREIEEVVSAYPGVAECSVIGIPDALRGQAICLYVVPREGETIDKKALRQYLIGRIAPYKVPREYFLVESLPKTALGKVRKNVLRDETVAILSKTSLPGGPCDETVPYPYGACRVPSPIRMRPWRDYGRTFPLRSGGPYGQACHAPHPAANGRDF